MTNAAAQLENRLESDQAAPFDIDDVMTRIYDKATLIVPLDTVNVRKGFNPRRYFDPSKLEELSESIKTQGVLQAIIVKPNSDKTGFDLIAGERRLRASNMAQIDSIPVVVRLVSDEEALIMAVAENAERDDVSASEEAKACHRMMGYCDGDRDETARALGWTRQKLDSRLLLLHCSDKVLEALETRNILIGHAELLSGLSKDIQNESLTGIINNSVSVADLKNSIGRYAYRLSEAVFDVQVCAQCQHNSSCTNDLFDTRLDNGQCLNRQCYDDKTKAFIQAKKEDIADNYPVIWLDIEKPPETRCYLIREGKDGVGKTQFSACHGCGNFGVLMLTEKGKECSIASGICFDVTCNQKMVGEHQKELAAIARDEQKHSASGGMKGTANTASGKSGSKQSKGSASETPKKVMEHVNSTHYVAAGKEVVGNRLMIKVFSLIALVGDLKDNQKESATRALLKKFGVKTLTSGYRRSDKVKELAKLDESTLGVLIQAFAGAVAGENQAEHPNSYDDYLLTAHTVLGITNADMAYHFQVDEIFLETLTISGLNALIEEAGFDSWYEDAHGEGSCKKNILTGKRNDQIKAIIKAGFDWKGFVPKVASIPSKRKSR